MGEGEEVKTRPDPHVEIQERGEIFFFYRPKVSKDEAHSPDDVQRLYFVLRPESGERPTEEKQSSDSGKEAAKKNDQASDSNNNENSAGKEGGHGSERVNIEKQPLLRLIVMGQKSLPDPGQKSRGRRPSWGFVELVTTDPEDIKRALKGEEYDTATRGHRKKPPARALGEGVYRILRHQSQSGRRSGSTHTHLVYKLELPTESERQGEGEDGSTESPQESLNVEREASYLLQIKNPEQGGDSSGFRGLQRKRKAAFPAHLQGRLGSRKFSAADPPDFLNYEGCEFLLISASDDIEEELGLELKGEGTGTEGRGSKECSDLIKMFGETASAKPLLTGTWV